MSSTSEPILVTGAAGQVGGIGGRIVELLRAADVPVRALVRRDDERAVRLRRLGAEVVIADLTQPEQVVPAVEGCRRAYFGMSVSPLYLEATLVIGAAAREIGDFELLVNMSQMTVSELDLRHMTESRQQRLHWLCEQALIGRICQWCISGQRCFSSHSSSGPGLPNRSTNPGPFACPLGMAGHRRSVRPMSPRSLPRFCVTQPIMRGRPSSSLGHAPRISMAWPRTMPPPWDAPSGTWRCRSRSGATMNCASARFRTMSTRTS